MVDVLSTPIRRMFLEYLTGLVRKTGDDNIRAFGFGIALKGNEVDIERPFCLRAYVTKKRPKRPKTRSRFEIQPEISFPLTQLFERDDAVKRRIRGPGLVFPTDVHEVGNLMGSARLAFLDGDPSEVSTGLIVRWQTLGELVQWGVLTVAHGYDPYDTAASAAIGSDVTILDPATGAAVRGKRMAELRAKTTGIDLSLISVDPIAFLGSGLISRLDTPPLRVSSYASQSSNGGGAGVVHQAGGRAFNFTVLGTVDRETFGGVGKVINLIHAKAPPNTFVAGTSGSPFSVVNVQSATLEPAGIQIGANSANRFIDGYGQSLETSLSLLEIELNKRLHPQGKYLVSRIEVVRVF